MHKNAETSGTVIMPANGPADKSVQPEKAVIKKTAMSPYVDVAGKSPPGSHEERAVQHYALPSLEKYPLDTYMSVKQAAVYFEEWGDHMDPAHRREFCSNLVKRANALSIKISPEIQKYGSATYAPTAEFEAAILGRQSILQDDLHKELLQKVASLQPTLSPDNFAIVLGEFDKLAGIDWMYGEHIPDNYYSTYGTKLAEADDETTVIEGNDIASAQELHRCARTRFEDLVKTYGEDFAKEFQKDPVGILKSLPVDQRKYLIRMATDNSPR